MAENGFVRAWLNHGIRLLWCKPTHQCWCLTKCKSHPLALCPLAFNHYTCWWSFQCLHVFVWHATRHPCPPICLDSLGPCNVCWVNTQPVALNCRETESMSSRISGSVSQVCSSVHCFIMTNRKSSWIYMAILFCGFRPDHHHISNAHGIDIHLYVYCKVTQCSDIWAHREYVSIE